MNFAIVQNQPTITRKQPQTNHASTMITSSTFMLRESFTSQLRLVDKVTIQSRRTTKSHTHELYYMKSHFVNHWICMYILWTSATVCTRTSNNPPLGNRKNNIILLWDDIFEQIVCMYVYMRIEYCTFDKDCNMNIHPNQMTLNQNPCARANSNMKYKI